MDNYINGHQRTTSVATSKRNPCVDVTEWQQWNVGSGDVISLGGNTMGSSYVSIAKNPTNSDTITTLISKDTFKLPAKVRAGISQSLVVAGTELFFGVVQVNDRGDPIAEAFPTDLVMPATVSVTTNVATAIINNHGLRSNARVSLYNNARSAMNLSNIVVTIVDANTFTFPFTIANGTYNAGGMIRVQEPGYNFLSYTGFNWINSATSALNPIKREGETPLYSTAGITTSTTVGTFGVSTPYADAINPAGTFMLNINDESVTYASIVVDSVNATPNTNRRDQITLNTNKEYKLVCFLRNGANITKPTLKIANIAKTGTTTATITTTAAHGLTVDSLISTYGVRDITNFPNLTTAVQVASIIDSTNFTAIVGAAVTASDAFGGSVIVQNGTATPASIASNFSVQSIARTSGITTLTINAAASGYTPGEKVYIHGMSGTAAQYDGIYTVLVVNVPANTFMLRGISSDQTADYTSINTGGTIIKVVDARIHYGQFIQYSRTFTESSLNSVTVQDANLTQIVGTPTVTLTSTTLSGGQAAHSSAVAGAPIRIGGKVVSTPDLTLVGGDTSDISCDDTSALITRPYGASSYSWASTAASGGIINTTDVVAKASAGASIRNYVTGIQLQNVHATVSTEFVIKDGATVIYRVFLPALMVTPIDIEFLTPLRGTANTAVNLACITTGAQVYANVQGTIGF